MKALLKGSARTAQRSPFDSSSGSRSANRLADQYIALLDVPNRAVIEP
jgi:hypothetical protein